METHNSEQRDLPEPETDMMRVMGYVLAKLDLSEEVLRTVVDRMRRDFQFGLTKKTNPKATVKMLPSYVTSAIIEVKVPKTYLALDLGGTNFRVLIVEIFPGQTKEDKPVITVDSKIYSVPQSLMSDEGSKLFDHMATCIADFIKIKDIQDQELPIGFTFSFPCFQNAVDSSTLLRWTKGFNCPGVEGQDVGDLLNEAIKRCTSLENFKVRVSVCCNDTVGTLMSCVFEDPDCMIGLIVGTGSNACYMEKTHHIETLSDEARLNSEYMVINSEWGNFGANGVLFDITSVFDMEVDRESPNPGSQTFEKMISGMYLGELVRRILVRMYDMGVIFYGSDIRKLREKGSLPSELVSAILGCDERNFIEIQNMIMKELEIGASVHDCKVAHKVCAVLSKRSAKLCACGVAAIAYQIVDPERRLKIPHPTTNQLTEEPQNPDANNSQQNGGQAQTPESDSAAPAASVTSTSASPKKRIVCGVDGTVYRRHPTFAKELKKYTDMLVPDNVQLEYVLSHDGSGKGAALTALVSELTARREEESEADLSEA